MLDPNERAMRSCLWHSSIIYGYTYKTNAIIRYFPSPNAAGHCQPVMGLYMITIIKSTSRVCNVHNSSVNGVFHE